MCDNKPNLRNSILTQGSTFLYSKDALCLQRTSGKMWPVENAQRRQNVVQGSFFRRSWADLAIVIRKLIAVTAILIKIMDEVLNLGGEVRGGKPENHPQVQWDHIKSCSIPSKIGSLHLLPSKHLIQYESILMESINVSQFSVV